MIIIEKLRLINATLKMTTINTNRLFISKQY